MATAAAAASPLTGAFQTAGERPFERTGLALLALLLVLAAATAAGLTYAVIDRRVRVGLRTRTAAGALVLASVAAGLAETGIAFAAKVDDPRRFAAQKWDAFASLPERRDEGATHFTSLGSNRYNFWHVSLAEFERRPLVGLGARGFRAAYLERRPQPRDSARARSLPVEVLAEQGVVGFVLLALALGAALALAARRLPTLPAVAALGAGPYWLVHASTDWILTVPLTGVLLFLLLGIAASGGGWKRRPLSRRARWLAGPALVALAVLAFAPPWLSSRLTSRALQGSSPSPARDLQRARQLDPLSVAPMTAEAALAACAAEAIPPLERAAELEPRSVESSTCLASHTSKRDGSRPRAGGSAWRSACIREAT